MIRRDYILRMIEEFLQALARLQSLKRGQLWDQAAADLEAQFQRLLASGIPAVLELSETELMARLLAGEPTPVVHAKTLLLVALLREAGDLAVAQDRLAQGQAFYLKGLHLLLECMRGQDAFERPEYVPGVEIFVAALADAPLPAATQAALMQHYENSGQFAKAEDVLYALLDADPDNRALTEFGLAFYERLSHRSDASLAEGNLPRKELEAGQEELRLRRKKGAGV